MRSVEITYSNGVTVRTAVASGLSDSQIYDYYRIGREFNLSSGADGQPEDDIQTVTAVEIIR